MPAASSRMKTEQIHGMLLGIDRRARRMAVAALVGGLILCVGVAAAAGLVVWLMEPYRATLGLYLVLVVTIVPLLWLGAWVRQGELAYDESDHWEPGGSSIYLRRADGTQTPGLVSLVSAALDIVLMPGRLAVYGYRRLRILDRLADVDREWAAEILQMLAESESGKAIERIAPTGAPQDRTVNTLRYLAFHELVGIGEKHRVVWLSTGARERLGCPMAS